MRVNIVSEANKAGLSRDIALLTAALRDCSCDITLSNVDSVKAKQRRSWQLKTYSLAAAQMHRFIGAVAPPPFDINIMLEHLWPTYFKQAHLNILIPNPEWFDRHDMTMLKLVDRIWAKTLNTKTIFEPFNVPSNFIGFDSIDCFRETQTKKHAFLHVAGQSLMKGTSRLLDIWRKHPEWPLLTIVQRNADANTLPVNNIEFITGYIDDAQLLQLQNSYAFHLCPSETEGWGHYLLEGMSVGAVVITLDAPPMNEFINPQRGLLLACAATHQQKQAMCYQFTEASLSDVIAHASKLQEDSITQLGSAAQKWFLSNKNSFPDRISQALATI